jgi:eukaryotic-like serine/threonine-protein kinase
VKEFLTSLFSAADPAMAQGREPSVRQLLERGAARIDTDLAGQPDVQSEVVRVVASVYQSLGEYDRIPPLLAADLDRRRRVDGPRSLAVAELLTQIADARYEQNRYDEAAGMYEEALAIQRERRGSRTPQVAELLWDLAGVKRNRGDLDGAETLERESLALYVDTKGSDSAEAMGVRESLAITEGQRGKLAEGVDLLGPVVMWRTTHFGVDHPDTLNSRYNLAVALQIADRPAEALATIDDVIARQRRVLGPRHDRLAAALRLRARALDALGRSEDGKTSIDEAFAIQAQEFGTRHLQVAIDRVWRAEIESHTGHLADAETDARAALDVFDSLEGSPPASVPPLRGRAALVLAEGGDLDRAGVNLARVVSELRAAGNIRAFLGEALDGLGEIERRRGNQPRAVELTRQGLGILEREAGPSHRATLLARLHAAAANWTADDEKASAAIRGVLADLEKRYPTGHADLATARALSGDLLVNAHRSSEARSQLEDALAWREAHLGPADRRTLQTRGLLRGPKP